MCDFYELRLMIDATAIIRILCDHRTMVVTGLTCWTLDSLFIWKLYSLHWPWHSSKWSSRDFTKKRRNAEDHDNSSSKVVKRRFCIQVQRALHYKFSLHFSCVCRLNRTRLIHCSSSFSRPHCDTDSVRRSQARCSCDNHIIIWWFVFNSSTICTCQHKLQFVCIQQFHL